MLSGPRKQQEVEVQKATLCQHLFGANFMVSCLQAERSVTSVPVNGALEAGLERSSLRHLPLITHRSSLGTEAKASSPVLRLP